MPSQKEVGRQNALAWRERQQAEADRLAAEAKALAAERDAKRAELGALDERIAGADTAARTARSQSGERPGPDVGNRPPDPDEHERQASRNRAKEKEAARLEGLAAGLRNKRKGLSDELRAFDERLAAASAAARTAQSQVSEWHPEG